MQTAEYGVTIAVNPTPVQHSTVQHSTGLRMITPRDGEGWNTLFSSAPEVSSGVQVTPQNVLGYPPLWRAIRLISSEVSGLPLDVFARGEGGDKTADRTHAGDMLVRREANPSMRADVLQSTMTAHAATFGNGLAWIERRPDRTPRHLWLMDPLSTVGQIRDGELHYGFMVDGKRRWESQRDVLHIRNMSHDGYFGHRIVTLLADALGVGMAAQQFGGRFFGNGANSSGMLMIPGSFSDDKIKNTLDAFQDMHESVQNAFKVMLLQDGAKFQQLTVPPEHGQFLETREYEIRATISSITGVPPHYLGDSTRTSHNSLEAERQTLLDNCINYWLREWENECNCKLLTVPQRQKDSHFFEFNRKAFLRMDFKSQVEAGRVQMEMGMSYNEWARTQNMPDIGPDGDKRYHPANWTEVGAQPQTIPAAPLPGEGSDDAEGEPTAQARALAAMVRSFVDQQLAVERDRVKRLANRSDTFQGFVDAADAFYSEKWVVTLPAGIACQTAVQGHATESMKQLREQVGAYGDDVFADAVKQLVAGWQDRGESLYEAIMGMVGT